MKLRNLLITLAINAALNQPAIADSNSSDIFNKDSNPHELSQVEIVNCSAENSAKNKDFQIENNDISYKNCKKALSKLVENLQKNMLITCDQDIQMSAAIVNINGLN